MQSPHEILGIDPDATEAEVERAYRRRVKETHPDQGGSVTEFLRVRTAYEELGDGHTAGGDPAGGAGPNTGPSRRRRREREHRRRNGHRGEDRDGRRRGAGGQSASADETPDQTVVEYLNYDVLVDRDWDLQAGDVTNGDSADGARTGDAEDGDVDGAVDGDVTGDVDAGDLGDAHLFERAAAAGLDSEDYGRFVVDEDESLLEAAERHGHEWPYSCRGGACANCAVAVLEGELSTPVNHILPDEMMARDVRLSCVGEPLTDRLRVVFNVKHLPQLDELRLPPHPSS